jgi:hypothetical protein
MMSREQQDAIENLMARGFSRVQATKVFYENSLQKYNAKENNHFGSNKDTGFLENVSDFSY